jgi:hypothetical protein
MYRLLPISTKSNNDIKEIVLVYFVVINGFFHYPLDKRYRCFYYLKKISIITRLN